VKPRISLRLRNLSDQAENGRGGGGYKKIDAGTPVPGIFICGTFITIGEYATYVS